MLSGCVLINILLRADRWSSLINTMITHKGGDHIRDHGAIMTKTNRENSEVLVMDCAKYLKSDI